MRIIFLTTLAVAGLALDAFADEAAGTSGGLFAKPGFFVEAQPAYVRLERTNRDLAALLLDAGVMVPSGEWFAHDVRVQFGFVNQETGERDEWGERYGRGTALYPMTVGYTLHVRLPGHGVSAYVGPRVGGMVAQVYESEQIGCDCWGGPNYDRHTDTETLFSWGGDAGVLASIDRNWGVDFGYSFRRIDGADFSVRGRGEVWSAQGVHMIRIGAFAKF